MQPHRNYPGRQLRPILLFMVFILLINPSCSDYGDYGESGPDFQELGTQMVSPDGGIVAFEGIEIDIPGGVFSESVEVKVLVDKSGDHVNNEGLCPLFKIEGFPKELNGGFEIKISLAGSVEGPPTASLGRRAYTPSLRKFRFPLYPINASLEDGKLIIPINDQRTKLETLGFNNPTPVDLTRGLEMGFTISAEQKVEVNWSQNKHFLIKNNSNFKVDTAKLGQYMERAFEICSEMGFSMEKRQWPMVVSVVSGADYFGAYNKLSYEPVETDADLVNAFDDGFIEISDHAFVNDEQLKGTALHELFHCVQNLYEFSSPDYEPEQAWLEEALSTWIEYKIVENPSFVSAALEGREMNLFKGWQKTGSVEDIGEHGYGLAPLIYGLHKVYGDAGIKQLFQEIMKGTIPEAVTDPVVAIDAVVQEPLPKFWHKVMIDFITGSYYNQALSPGIVNNSQNYKTKVTIKAKKGFVENVQLNMKDLSAQLIQLEIPNSQLEELGSLSVEVVSNNKCGLFAYKYRPNQAAIMVGNKFPGSTGKVSIPDFKSIIDEGYLLGLMVTNGAASENFEETNTVNLKIEASEKGNFWEFAYQCRFWGLFSYDGGNKSPSSILFNNIVHPVIIEGDGKKFESNFSFDNGAIWLDVEAEGSITIEVDDEGIASLEVNMSWHKMSTGLRQRESFKIAGIPLTEVDGRLRTYSTSGHHLFSNRSFTSSTNNANVLRYEGIDPEPDLDKRNPESILVYLRERH